MERLYQILKNIILIIFSLMLFLLLFMSCIQTVYFDTGGSFYMMGDSPLLKILMLACVALLGGLVYRAVAGSGGRLHVGAVAGSGGRLHVGAVAGSGEGLQDSTVTGISGRLRDSTVTGNAERLRDGTVTGNAERLRDGTVTGTGQNTMQKMDWPMLISTMFHIAVMVAFVLLTQFRPVSDELSCMNAAADLLDGDNSAWLKPNYMFLYPFQGGLVLAEYLVSLVAGPNNYVVLELLNVAFYAYALWNVYCILLYMQVQKKLARLIYIASPLWFPLMLYVSFVYGNIVGLMLALLGVRLMLAYFEKGGLVRLAGTGLCMGLACVLKSNYMITMAACCCVCALQSIRRKRVLVLAAIVGMIAGYVLVKTITFGVLENMTGIETPDGIPMSAWVAMGMYDTEDYGWFNNYNGVVYARNNYDYDTTNAECIGMVRNRFAESMRSPRRWFKFFYVKTLSQWAEPTFQCFNILTTRETDIAIGEVLSAIIYEGTVNGFIRRILDAAQTLVYFGALAFAWFERRKVTPAMLVFPIAFIGGFIFHMFWEAKGQYTIIYFWMMIPYALMGWKEVCVRMGRICENLQRGKN